MQQGNATGASYPVYQHRWLLWALCPALPASIAGFSEPLASIAGLFEPCILPASIAGFPGPLALFASIEWPLWALRPVYQHRWLL